MSHKDRTEKNAYHRAYYRKQPELLGVLPDKELGIRAGVVLNRQGERAA